MISNMISSYQWWWTEHLEVTTLISTYILRSKHRWFGAYEVWPVMLCCEAGSWSWIFQFHWHHRSQQALIPSPHQPNVPHLLGPSFHQILHPYLLLRHLCRLRSQSRRLATWIWKPVERNLYSAWLTALVGFPTELTSNLTVSRCPIFLDCLPANYFSHFSSQLS